MAQRKQSYAKVWNENSLTQLVSQKTIINPSNQFGVILYYC